MRRASSIMSHARMRFFGELLSILQGNPTATYWKLWHCLQHCDYTATTLAWYRRSLADRAHSDICRDHCDPKAPRLSFPPRTWSLLDQWSWHLIMKTDQWHHHNLVPVQQLTRQCLFLRCDIFIHDTWHQSSVVFIDDCYSWSRRTRL